MKKLSLILIICIILTTFVPFTASALTYGDWEYTVSNNEVTITKYIGYGTDITIPTTINGLTVKAIGQSAFYNYKGLTSVIMPDNVIRIGDYAFEFCSNLKSINIPTGVTNIGRSAFGWCSSLTSVTIPSGIKIIYPSTFSLCSGLTSVTIMNGVTDIQGGAFSSCSNLTNIIIPESVTIIRDSAFSNCGLKVAYFEHSDASKITTFGQDVFYNTAPDFKIIYPANATGFTTPTWKGCAAYPDNESSLPTAVTGVSLNKTTATIELGRNETLTATASPANAANKNITWSSSNPTVAVVVGNGVVVPLSTGTAVITARTADGGFTASCTVTVVEAKPENIIGDVNGDGKVNIADLIRLSQWLAEINTTPLGEP